MIDDYFLVSIRLHSQCESESERLYNRFLISSNQLARIPLFESIEILHSPLSRDNVRDKNLLTEHLPTRLLSAVIIQLGSGLGLNWNPENFELFTFSDFHLLLFRAQFDELSLMNTIVTNWSNYRYRLSANGTKCGWLTNQSCYDLTETLSATAKFQSKTERGWFWVQNLKFR